MTKRQRRILVVDDDDEIRAAVVELLADEIPDCVVDEADSGFTAVKLSSKHSYDLVITDYRMPGMTGVELMRRIHEQRPRLPYILLTAFYQDAMKDLVGKENEATVLHKPMAADDLLEDVRLALGEPPPAGAA